MPKRSLADFIRDTAAALDGIVPDGDVLVIDRPGQRAVAVIDLGELESLRETLHLLGTAANARRLFRSMEEAGRGLFVEVSRLPEPFDEPSAP